MKKILYLIICFLSAVSIAAGKTTVSISKTQWQINGEVTYPGTAAEGLLMNVRMVNSTFEDRKRTDIDSGCSWGFMHKKLNQYVPFEFNGYDDDRNVYDKFKELTGRRD